MGAAEGALDVLGDEEEGLGREVCEEAGAEVTKAMGGRKAPGLGVIVLRDRLDFAIRGEEAEGLTQGLLPLTQIGSE